LTFLGLSGVLAGSATFVEKDPKVRFLERNKYIGTGAMGHMGPAGPESQLQLAPFSPLFAPSFRDEF